MRWLSKGDRSSPVNSQIAGGETFPLSGDPSVIPGNEYQLRAAASRGIGLAPGRSAVVTGTGQDLDFNHTGGGNEIVIEQTIQNSERSIGRRRTPISSGLSIRSFSQ